MTLNWKEKSTLLIIKLFISEKQVNNKRFSDFFFATDLYSFITSFIQVGQVGIVNLIKTLKNLTLSQDPLELSV
jgi:hypothetical protein